MLDFLIANAGTIVVGAGLAAVIALVIRKLYRDRKAGKSCCGGSCSNCKGCH